MRHLHDLHDLPASHDLPGLAARLRALPPSCGPVRLVAVDGHAGSGKSTFAARLAEAAGGAAAGPGARPGPAAGPGPAGAAQGPGPGPAHGTGSGPGPAPAPAPVLHLDDLASHEELFDWTGRLCEEVISPLSAGRSARYHPYDWNLRRFLEPRTLPAAPLVLVEGVGAGRRALRPRLAALLWMERGAEESWARGRRRDGPAQAAFWDGWTPAESRHFAADPSRPYADLLVCESGAGYTWRGALTGTIG
ncbi:hypothetical protein [Streptomyces sp. NPDC005805]|uniref:hypothetical protein n=1 Tax=Streptomyces sp. NPDC005805 TaxID=3157068 RepID=UPI0033C4373D